MAAMTDVLIPALEDAREAHAAVVDRFRTDVNATPPGTHRERLERQVAEAQYHLARIEDRVREMRPSRGLLSAAGQLMWLATRSGARAAMLPVQAGASAVLEILRGRTPADERRMLRNAEDEYAAAARALATCRAGKGIAEHLQDQETADLLDVLRRQDEQLLERLEEHLAQRARAVAAATDGGPAARREVAEGGSLLDALLRRLRLTVARLRAALRRGTRRVKGTAEGAWREMPDAARMAGEVQGAITREQDLPIAGFSQLGVTEVHQRLRGLSQTELTVIEGYERAHAGRPGVLNAIRHLREAEPWAGYDSMDPERIKIHLQDVSFGAVRKVREYERRHRQRETVIKAAESALGTSAEATHRTEEDVSGAPAHVQEPWAGYDAMGPEEILGRLGQVSAGVARQVLDYERRGRQRPGVISAAQSRIPG